MKHRERPARTPHGDVVARRKRIKRRAQRHYPPGWRFEWIGGVLHVMADQYGKLLRPPVEANVPGLKIPRIPRPGSRAVGLAANPKPQYGDRRRDSFGAQRQTSQRKEADPSRSWQCTECYVHFERRPQFGDCPNCYGDGTVERSG